MYRSLLKVETTLDKVELALYKAITSANDWLSVLNTSGSSRIYRQNRSGPRTEPCGTPRVHGEGKLRPSAGVTCCCRFVR